MKFKSKKILVLTVIMSIFTGIIAGCTRSSSTDPSTTVVATYGDEKLYLDEAKFFAKLSQYSYEASFGVSQEFWSYKFSGDITWEESVKQDVMKRILQTKILCDQANKDGIVLTEEEKELVKKQVKSFLEDEHMVSVTGANETLLEKVYTENAIANKVYASLIADVDTNVNEDDFKRKKIDYLHVTEDDNSDTDESAEVEKMKTALEEGKSVSDIASEYEDTSYKVEKASSVAFGESDEEGYVAEAWKMVTDEVKVIAVEGDGWYVVKCISDDDKEAREAAIEEEIQSREDKMFQKKYEQIKANGKEFTVDEKVWATITFKEAAYVETSTKAETSTEEESKTLEESSSEESSQAESSLEEQSTQQ